MFQERSSKILNKGNRVDLISGFSRLSRKEKIDFVVDRFFDSSNSVKEDLKSFWHGDPKKQNRFDEFSENTLTNFFYPYGVVPNVKINGELFCVPMVTEESSVVAGASKAAKFWFDKGGVKTQNIGHEKIGQVHFTYQGDKEKLFEFFEENKRELLDCAGKLSFNMQKRGGGLKSLSILDKRESEPDYYQLFCHFSYL